MADSPNDLKEKLYEDYHPRIMAYICSKVNNQDLAEDLCSDVFLKVCEKLDSFDDSKASISTWIYAIARNRLIDFYRTRHVSEEIPEELVSDYSIEEQVLGEEQLETLTKGLKMLDERLRDLIILHYYKGATLKEIAAAMDISYPYAKILHGKALKQLSEFMS